MHRRRPIHSRQLSCVAFTVVGLTFVALVSLWQDRLLPCDSDDCSSADRGCAATSPLARCVQHLRDIHVGLTSSSLPPDALLELHRLAWRQCDGVASALVQFMHLRHTLDTRGGLVLNADTIKNVTNMVYWHTTAKRAQCGRVRDLSTEFMQHTSTSSKDVLQQMLACGLQPKLLSKFVSRKDSSLWTDYKVPNVVHYIRFGTAMVFDMQQYLSYLSVHKFIEPQYIFVHGDSLPRGEWWARTLREVANIFHVPRKKPTTIFDQDIGYIEHTADFARLHILIEYGGIYLDHDVIVLKSFNPLRNYDVTLGREMPSLLANGIIVARKGAPFLRIWLETYRNYDRRSWAAHSTHTPHSLSMLLPHLLHVEERSIVRPNWAELHLLYRKHYDWRDNYCVHLYLSERFQVPTNITQMDSYDCTVGEVMRYVYYGRPDIVH